MKVQLLPADRSGCAYYRMELPNYYAPESFLNCDLRAIRDGNGQIIDGVPASRDVDVVVLQRPLKKMVYDLIPYLQRRGIAVVVEIDDDLTSIPRDNVFWDRLQPGSNPTNNITWGLKAANIADHVIVSSDRLAGVYGRHGRVTVIRNYIDDYWFDHEPERDERPWVGWTGSVGTHPHDLEVLGRSFRTILDDHDAFGYIIGGVQAFEPLGLDGDMADFVDWVPLEEYPEEIGRLHVGIAPLTPGKFNQAKSWLKPLEYAAMGVFSVVSDLPEYRQLKKELGSEFIHTAKRYREWVRSLDHFISLSKTDEQDQMRKTLRAYAKRLSVSANTWRWQQAWEEALKYRRALTPKNNDWPLEANPLFGRIVPDKDVDQERNAELRQKNEEFRGAVE